MGTLIFIAEAAATLFESFVILLTLFQVLECDMPRSVQRAFIAAGSAVFGTATIALDSVSQLYGDLPDLIVVVMYIAVSLTVFKGKRLMRMIMPVILMIMILIINISAAALTSRLAGVSVENTINGQGSLRIMLLVVTKLLFFILAQLLAKRVGLREPELSLDEWVWLTLIFVFSSAMLFIAAQMMFFGGSKEQGILMLTAAIAVTDIGVYAFAGRLTRKNRELYELKMINIRTAEQMKALNSIESVYTEMRILRHDMKNRWIVVNDALRGGDIGSAQQAVNKTLESIGSYDELIKLKSPAISAVINYKLSAAKRKNISVITSIHDSFDGFEEYDILMLLSNLLDNALEASEHAAEPQIEVTSALKRGYLNITVSNRIDGSVLESNPKLATTKQDKLSHGLGLRSVRRICEKYDGSAEFYEHDKTFTADILLKIGGGRT